MTVSWQVDGRSDVGRMRKGNEDSYRVDADRGLFIVADGMGGHAAGEVASRLAADGALETLMAVDTGTGTPVEGDIERAFREAHRRIVECCEGDPATEGMGTTLTLAAIDREGNARIGHIGDSRIYQLSGETLRQLTHDHTWVQQEVDAGRVPRDAARSHPLSHILTRVLTAGDPPDPDVRAATVHPGDVLLLCSDGLYNMVEPTAILEILRTEGTVEEIGARLVRAANDAGGADNITTIVIRIS